jgi:hypothetical protein
VNARRFLACAVVVAILSLGATTAAEPLPEVTPITESVTIRADGGAELRVPPGYYVPTPTWAALDAEMKRLGDAETRLAAENKSLRASLNEGPGWGTMLIAATAAALGMGAGAWVF